MKCHELEGRWEDWLRGEAMPELEQHLRECAACRELAAELPRASRWLALAAQEPFEPAPGFWARLEERLTQSDRGGDFWAALAWSASRAAVVLAALVVLLTFGVWRQASEPAEFDAPQAYLEEPVGSVPIADGQLNRDQVVLTLVARAEAPR